MRSILLVAALAAGVSAPVAFAQFSVSPGFSGHALPVGAGAFVGGIDVLPNGNLALFDGTAVVEMDPATGGVVQTFFTPPGFTFGSFVVVDPTGTYLLFGESSVQNIWKIPLSGGPPRVVARIQYNYDCVFAGPDRAYITHADSTWTSTELVLLDVSAQTIDPIAFVPGASGPVVLAADGDLFYGESGSPGQGRVYFWTKGQLASAVGPGQLGASDATQYIIGVGNISDIVFDNQGDLLIADSILGTLDEYDSAGHLRGRIAAVSGGGGITYLALIDEGEPDLGVFGPYQPASGGAVAAVYSDWLTVTDVNIINPERLGLVVTPGLPVPTGSFSVDLSGGPELGRVLLCLAAGPVVPEYSAWVGDVPFLFGLDTATLAIAAPLALDATGSISLTDANPGWNTTIHVQGALFDATFRPLGSTTPLTLVLD